MLIYQNSKLEIHDVGVNSKADPSLHEVEVVDGTFDGWSTAKICCYRAEVVDGNVVMLTPYVDSRLIEHIDQLGSGVEKNSFGVHENSNGIFDLGDVVDENSTAIFDLADYIESLEERVTALEEKGEE